MRYLKSRNLSDAAIRLFGIHWETSGQFRDRLVFPIHDARGQQIAAAGRVLDNSLPKYVNSPESSAYKKSHVLYNLHRAAPRMEATGFVFITEGYMDVISAWQAGVENIVATCGTSLTEEHCRIVRRAGVRPILAFDNDEAGRKATNRAMEMLERLGVEPFFADLDDAKDVDDFVSRRGHFLPSVRQPATRDRGDAMSLLARIAKTVPSLRPAIHEECGIEVAPDRAEQTVTRLEDFLKTRGPSHS